MNEGQQWGFIGLVNIVLFFISLLFYPPTVTWEHVTFASATMVINIYILFKMFQSFDTSASDEQ